MTDTRTPEQRQRIMTAVRAKDTSPEMTIRRALYAAGVRGWRCHYKRAAGKPDLAWPALQVALFVDGAFWHGHPSRHRPGRSGRYWDEKIARNVSRDRQVDADLAAAAWTVLRVWDFEIRRDLTGVVSLVVATLGESLDACDPGPAIWQRRLRRQQEHRGSAVANPRSLVYV
jgi:DNA mismatch endonuclease (patch repair protein)